MSPDDYMALAGREAAKDAPERAARRAAAAETLAAELAAAEADDAARAAAGTDTASLARAEGYGDDILSYLLAHVGE